MSETKPSPEPACRDCGWTNDPGASECWFCHRSDWKKDPDLRRGRPMSRVSRRGPMSTIGGWMTLIAVIGAAVGIFREALGLAVVLLVSVLIGLIQALAAKRFMADRRGGKPMSGREEAAWTLVLSIVIPILAAVSLVVALFHYFQSSRL